MQYYGILALTFLSSVAAADIMKPKMNHDTFLQNLPDCARGCHSWALSNNGCSLDDFDCHCEKKDATDSMIKPCLKNESKCDAGWFDKRSEDWNAGYGDVCAPPAGTMSWEPPKKTSSMTWEKSSKTPSMTWEKPSKTPSMSWEKPSKTPSTTWEKTSSMSWEKPSKTPSTTWEKTMTWEKSSTTPSSTWEKTSETPSWSYTTTHEETTTMTWEKTSSWTEETSTYMPASEWSVPTPSTHSSFYGFNHTSMHIESSYYTAPVETVPVSTPTSTVTLLVTPIPLSCPSVGGTITVTVTATRKVPSTATQAISRVPSNSAAGLDMALPMQFLGLVSLVFLLW